MTPITEQEQAVVSKLIVEAETGMAEIGAVIGGDDPVIEALRNARDFLRGVRDAGHWCQPDTSAADASQL